MRAQGKTYSEIKALLKVGKSSLSLWLRDMPLSPEQMRAVRDFSPKRIERYRATMQKKRDDRLGLAYEKAKNDIGNLNERELFLTGLFLYWGEGAKTMRGTVTVSNTDPEVIRFFLRWLEVLGVERSKVRIRLHLYTDMNIKEETRFWAQLLNLSQNQFLTPYVKTSALTDITFKTGYGHGTCNVYLGSMALWEYIMMSLKWIRTGA